MNEDKIKQIVGTIPFPETIAYNHIYMMSQTDQFDDVTLR